MSEAVESVAEAVSASPRRGSKMNSGGTTGSAGQGTQGGYFPPDWEMTSLGELFTEFRGGAPLKPSDFTASGVKVLPKGGVGRTGWLQVKDGDFQYCSRRYAAEHRGNQVDQTYTIVVLRDLVPSGPSIGLVVQIRAEDTYVLAQGVYGFKVNHVLDTRFLVHLSNTNWYRKLMNSIMVGSTQVHVTNTAFKLVRIPVPSKAEQSAIASALSDADALIEALEQLIAKKRHVKKGAMQELLSPKDGWVEKTLQNTATLKARIGWQGLTTAEYLDTGDYYLVTGTDFKDGYIDWDNCPCVEELRYKQDRNIQLRLHDVLVTKDGTIGKVAMVNCLDKPATLNSGVFVIRPIEGAFHPDFFYYLLCSNVFSEFLAQLSAGSTINHLYQKDFVTFKYKTPRTIEEQVTIAAIFSDMDAEISALKAKLFKARQIKQGMMHNLLTGRTRMI
ncbi:MAG: restriction endonuclease subunit S [Rhodospirillaceae bacterium]|nr:restriction endonuclease subunit S [Rhodospirillaceae bacterium]